MDFWKGQDVSIFNVTSELEGKVVLRANAIINNHNKRLSLILTNAVKETDCDEDQVFKRQSTVAIQSGINATKRLEKFSKNLKTPSPTR